MGKEPESVDDLLREAERMYEHGSAELDKIKPVDFIHVDKCTTGMLAYLQAVYYQNKAIIQLLRRR